MTVDDADLWKGVLGQQRAVRRLQMAAVDPVHAYLFVGPPGSTKDIAARAFAATLMARTAADPDRAARLVLAGEHPDVSETRRSGASISKDQILEIIRVASMAPMEGDRKVLILDEFHLVDPLNAPRLLKTFEEPPASTVFIVLADQVPTDLVTIASRCVRIDFAPIDETTIRDTLVAEGHPLQRAEEAAAASAGSVDRARLLVDDEGLSKRRAAFAGMPSRLDGTGRMVVEIADEIVALADEAADVLTPVHAAERDALDKHVAAVGERGSGRKQLEERHKREVRRYRTDELRSGLTVMAGAYRDGVVAGTAPRADAAIRAVSRIHVALEALDRNPNEALLLQSLLLDLPSL
jgi:DNA polymerase III subunit delta'